MRRLRWIGLTAGLVAGLVQAVPAADPPRPLTDAECQTMRGRLAAHAKLSAGARRAVAARAAASPAPPPASPAVASAPAPAPPATVSNRADEIRARLQKIPVERQQAEDGRLGALGRFDLGRVAQYQAQLTALDQERARLEQEQAGLASRPSAPAAPAPAPTPTPPAPARVSDSDSIRCQEMRAAHDEAVAIRLRELGAKEAQPGVVPLVALEGQSADQIAQELRAQMPSASPGSQIGLLDVNGDGRLDGFVDVPVKDVYRVYRQKPDGTLGVEVSAGGGNAAAYGDMARQLEETGNRQGGRSLADLLAIRAAGPVRVTAETADFASANGHWLAGNFAEAARLEGAAARSVEFQNWRGEVVRVTEILTPVNGGVALRRLVAQPRSGDQEQWDETTTAVRLPSYGKTDVEIAQGRETRSTVGAPVGARSTTAAIRFSLSR
jgi:hypothetical protein